MPNLAASLHDRDLGFLKIIAEHWGLDLPAPDARTALPELVRGVCDPERVSEGIEALPEPAREALARLQHSRGRMPWTDFARTAGAIREVGPARRDRERPDLQPSSAAEILWYRGLLGRGFFDTPRGPREFAFIPDDLFDLLSPAHAAGQTPLLGGPASPAMTTCPLPANDAILNQATTLLAALRMKIEPPKGNIPTPALTALLNAVGVLDAQSAPKPEAARDFLEAPRSEALAILTRAWRASSTFNELRLLPGLRCEGEWTNDAVHARSVVLDAIAGVPSDEWWDLASFVRAIHERMPDFQRPAGDYDSWFIRQETSGEYLRGFEHWDEVDGAMVRYILCGPLHWLGILDLATREPGGEPSAFRRSKWAEDLLAGEAPAGVPIDNATLQIQRDGRLLLPVHFPRAVRYQVARYADWEDPDKQGYHYRLTPASLERAREQGLRAGALIGLLRKHASAPPQPTLVQALERWDANGTQARLEPLLVLRVSSPEIMAELRKSRAGRFVGEPLGSTAAIIAPAVKEKVLAALAEMGYLAEAGNLE